MNAIKIFKKFENMDSLILSMFSAQAGLPTLANTSLELLLSPYPR